MLYLTNACQADILGKKGRLLFRVSQHFCNWLSLVMQSKPGDLSQLDYILFIKLNE